MPFRRRRLPFRSLRGDAADDGDGDGHARCRREEVLHGEADGLGEVAQGRLARIGLPVRVRDEADGRVEGEVPAHAGEFLRIEGQEALPDEDQEEEGDRGGAEGEEGEGVFFPAHFLAGIDAGHSIEEALDGREEAQRMLLARIHPRHIGARGRARRLWPRRRRSRFRRCPAVSCAASSEFFRPGHRVGQVAEEEDREDESRENAQFHVSPLAQFYSSPGRWVIKAAFKGRSGRLRRALKSGLIAAVQGVFGLDARARAGPRYRWHERTRNGPTPTSFSRASARPKASLSRAELKIFFGMSAGVGKTYAMLQEARAARAQGVDIVLGDHRDPRPTRDRGPRVRASSSSRCRSVEYRGVLLEELDLDALIARRPAIAVVDELAHANAPGSRHVKRWQDVLELLDRGISVWTAINVQHMESYADVVEDLTGARVRERVPDTVFDRADEVRLIDVAPEDLIRRLEEGCDLYGRIVARGDREFLQAEEPGRPARDSAPLRRPHREPPPQRLRPRRERASSQAPSGRASASASSSRSGPPPARPTSRAGPGGPPTPSGPTGRPSTSTRAPP